MAGAQNRTKHVPERTCVACRQKRPKWELVRIVHTPQDTLEIDSRGKKTGRGAYLCKSRECWDVGFHKKRLEYALKTVIGPEQRLALLKCSEVLFAAGK